MKLKPLLRPRRIRRFSSSSITCTHAPIEQHTIHFVFIGVQWLFKWTNRWHHKKVLKSCVANVALHDTETTNENSSEFSISFRWNWNFANIREIERLVFGTCNLWRRGGENLSDRREWRRRQLHAKSTRKRRNVKWQRERWKWFRLAQKLTWIQRETTTNK